jgi:hypothetical protein
VPPVLDAALRPELPAEATELAHALREPVWRRLELVPERLAVLWVPSTERRAGRVASPASVAALVERQEPLSRSEPVQDATAQLASALLAGVVRSATVRAAAWLALARPAPV